MPASRLASRRRKSSLGLGITLAQAGNYGLTSPRPITFAPNVTPGTYVEDGDGEEDSDDNSSPTDALFPPTQVLQPTASRRRAPPGKRRSQGYIPRPPNAFMLFRANFVRQKHVPGSIETNHGSLSKIIGNIWKNLPPDEQETWKKLAKRAKAEHRQLYPNYRFRPVHNKSKVAKRKDKTQPDPLDERRCEEVAQLLLDGKKGDELTAAVRQLDMSREQWSASVSPPPSYGIPMAAPTPLYAQRRSSSVPPPTTLYNPISIPTVPFFSPFNPHSRPESPVGHIARANQMNRHLLGQRRPSSTGPTYWGTWTTPAYAPIPFEQLQRDDEPLPDVPTGLFNTSFGFGPSHDQIMFADPGPQTNLAVSISPLDDVHGMDPLANPLSASTTISSGYTYGAPTPVGSGMNGMPWVQQHLDDMTLSGSASPSTFSASPPPAPSDATPTADASLGMCAPQPQHPAQTFQAWDDATQSVAVGGMEEMGLGLQPMEYPMDLQSGMSVQAFTTGLEHMDLYGSASQCAIEAQDYAFQQDFALALEAQEF